jgi:hypothetical protein
VGEPARVCAAGGGGDSRRIALIETSLERRWNKRRSIALLRGIRDAVRRPTQGDSMPTIPLRVNRKSCTVECSASTLLVEALREQLRLTGTHVGCDTSQCGACTVHVNGRSVKSCTMLAVEAEGADVTTIEGLAEGGKLHPM